MKKEKPHSNPNHEGPGKQERHIDGSIHVRGTIEADLPPDVRKKQDAANEKQDAREAKRYVVEIVTLIAVIVYAGLTAWQAFLTRQLVITANKTFELSNRPYLGVNGIRIEHVARDASGQIMRSPTPQPWTVDMGIDVDVKNFGTVPATNVKSTWAELFAGVDRGGGERLSDTPSTVFQGTIVTLPGETGKNAYPEVIKGTTKLDLRITFTYDGPSGHYVYCQNEEYSPVDNMFLDTGLCH
jgi:hypothetical protein